MVLINDKFSIGATAYLFEECIVSRRFGYSPTFTVSLKRDRTQNGHENTASKEEECPSKSDTINERLNRVRHGKVNPGGAKSQNDHKLSRDLNFRWFVSVRIWYLWPWNLWEELTPGKLSIA